MDDELATVDGWLVLAVIASAFAAATPVVAVWRAFHSDFVPLLVVPLNLALWAWIAGGALRRHRSAPPAG